MTNIVVAFSRQGDAKNIKNILMRNGFQVVAVCTSGSQVLSSLEDLSSGIVVSGYRFEDMMYQEGEVQLEKGSSIYLYTDGVTESINEKEELYGEDRLDIVLNRHKEDGPDKILEAVKESMDEFVGEAEQFDDITMLCLTYRG